MAMGRAGTTEISQGMKEHYQNDYDKADEDDPTKSCDKEGDDDDPEDGPEEQSDGSVVFPIHAGLPSGKVFFSMISLGWVSMRCS